MKLKESKTYRTLLSYFLVLCIVCGLVGSHAPAEKVEAANAVSSYTVTLNGRADGTRFCMYNEKASDGSITLSYTVDEFVGDIGYNGVLAWSGAPQYVTYPEMYGSIYKSQTITGGYLNPFMQTGCTYTLTLGLDAEGKLTFSGSYVNQEGETIELTPVSTWARTESPDGTASGGDYGAYKHFGLFFGNSCTGTLTNVTCVDAKGNDLGITSNQTGPYVLGVQKEAEKTEAPGYTVSLNGRADGTRFCMYNQKASNGPITLSYTVDEFVGDIGYNGVLAWSGAPQYNTYPEMYGSIYKAQKNPDNTSINPFMKSGCTYTLTFGLDAEGKLTFSGSYVNQEGETIELTPVSTWARTESPNGTASGGDYGKYTYFGLFFGNSCTGTLTNVTCVDEEGKDLGITSNQTGAYELGVQKGAEKAEAPSYTVSLNGRAEGTRFCMYNGKASNGPITFSYTVDEFVGDIGYNGVLAWSGGSQYNTYPEVYGSIYKSQTITGGYLNPFMQTGCTYTLTLGLDAEGKLTFSGSYVNQEGETIELTPVSTWARTESPDGTASGGDYGAYKHFGLFFGNSCTGTLTNVTCVDAKGNDLGITSNQTGPYVLGVQKEAEKTEAPGYTVSLNGRADGTRFCMYNQKASNGPITLSYTVDEFVGDIGYNGVLAWSGAPQYNTYPEMYGSIYKAQKNPDNTSINPFMKSGCTYTLTFGLDAEGKLTFSGSYVNQEGETIELTPVSTWARTESPDGTASGGDYGKYTYFGLFFGNSCTGTLTNVTCVDAKGNDLGITSNQTGEFAIEVEKNGEEPGGDSGEEPGGSQEENYDSTNWTKYNVTLGGSASSLFLSNKTATSGPVILRYTVAETSAKESAGNNGVLASTSPTAPFPYAYGNGSMLFNAPTNYMMKAGCTYTLKLSLDANGFVTVDGYYIDEAGNKTGNLKAYLPRTAGSNNVDCQHFGIYIERKNTATLTNVSCVDETGKDLGLQVNQLGCTFENLSGDTGDAVVEEKLPSDYTMITLGNFGIKDGTYRGTFKQGFYALSMHKTVFSVDVEFSTDLGEDLRYGSKVDGWHGLRFWSQENNLLMEDVDGRTETYVFDMVVANMKLVGEKINLKISTEYVDSDSDGVKDDVKLGVWFNDKLYNNEYIYLKNYKNTLGKYMSVYSAAKAAYITVNSVEGVHTGVDYSIWGYTNNWKKEMGIE